MTAWRLDCGVQTLVLASKGDIPAVVYWGARLPQGEDLQQLAASRLNDLTGGMLDVLADITLTPCGVDAFFGQPALGITTADGAPIAPVFTLDEAKASDRTLVFTSVAPGLRLIHTITAQATGVFTLQSRLEAKRAVRVDWLAAPVLPATQAASQMIDVSGKWTREFHLNQVAWQPGIRMRESLAGRSGHEHPPYLILPEAGCTNDRGHAYALHYAWSGGHHMVAEELPDGRRMVQFGHATGAYGEAGRVFETAPLIAVFSASGLNGIAEAFQRDIRDRVVTWPKPEKPRPVHYNCWEAVYFTHDASDLCDIADRAHALGAERFVLDDGWFGKRDDDTSSLGDWQIDKRKWPDGLHPLIDHVHKLGMTFGLWFEPEMVNPNSDLMRAHPDWCLGPKGQITGRNQLVLNMARDDVRDHLFVVISAILSDYDIDYIKWDHNRLLPVNDVAQANGTYALLDRLRAAHPNVEIESCASGGGRIDAGILARTQRVWLSDSNDALERLRIQHDAALFLPSAVTGSHVGPRHCHTSGRVLPMAFRAWVAAQRHMGFEMDPRELTDEETAILADTTTWYKANREWMMAGTIRRIDSDDPAVVAEMQISADGSRFVVFAGQAESSVQILPRPVRLNGLDLDAYYRIALRNPEAKAAHSRGPTALKSGPLTLSGQALMGQGILLPVAWPATMWVVEGRRI